MEAEFVEPEVVEQPWRPWGFWTTLGMSLVVAIAVVGAHTAVATVFVLLRLFADRQADPAQLAESLETNGLLLAVATWAAAPVACGLVILFALLRKPRSLRRYLALEPVSLPAMAGWVALVVLFAACSDGLTILVGRPVIPEFMIASYRTAGFLPLLWTALILMAPLIEELLFRGFAFEGIAHSRCGPLGAIVLTSAAWAACHMQYDLYHMGIIFAGGLLLGAARWRSGSLYPALAMHAVMNLIATVQVAVYLR